MLQKAQTDLAAGPKQVAGWLYSLTGVLCAAGFYSLLHVGARLIASQNLGEEDPLDAILSQTLHPGYLPDQPPLFNWLVWLQQWLTGPTTLTFQLIKYGLLIATCGFIFLSARRVMKGDVFWAFLSVEGLALIYQLSWRFHEGFTHGVGALCAVTASFWALMRLIERQRLADYAILGLAAGLGMLTVQEFRIFFAALLGAALLQPSIRQLLLRPELLLTLTLAAILASPYFLWLAQNGASLENLSLFQNWGASAADPGKALSAMRKALTEPVMSLAPLIFLYPLFFPGMIASVRQTIARSPNRTTQPDYEQLILHMTLINLGFLLVEAALIARHEYATQTLLPLFLITSIWLTAQARRAASSASQVRHFVAMAVAIAIVAFAGRAANMFVLEPVCNICRWGVPYTELAAEMKRVGFHGGQIVTVDEELGGNLLRFFPEARIILADGSAYTPPTSNPNGDTALVWQAPAKDRSLLATNFQRHVPSVTAGDLSRAETLNVPWRGHLWKPDGYRVSSWRILLLPNSR